MHLYALLPVTAVLAGTAVTVVALQAGPASAQEPGLAWLPATGSASTPLEVVTTGPCPASAPNVVGVLYGAGFPRTGQRVIGNTEAGVSSGGPFTLVLGDTLRGFAALQPAPVTFTGTYRLVVTCREPLDPTSRRDFVGTVVFSAAGGYTARQPRTLPRPATEPAPVGRPAGPGAASGGTAGAVPQAPSGTAATRQGRSEPGPASPGGPVTGAAQEQRSSPAALQSAGLRATGEPRVPPGLLLLGAGLLLGVVSLVLAAAGRRSARTGRTRTGRTRTGAALPDDPAASAAGAPSRPTSP